MTCQSDVNMVCETVAKGGQGSALSTKLSAARYLDGFRKKGQWGKCLSSAEYFSLMAIVILRSYCFVITVSSYAAWVLTDEDKNVFSEAQCSFAPSQELLSRAGALQYLDRRRLMGHTGWCSINTHNYIVRSIVLTALTSFHFYCW